jgi:ABC-type uncharacterized transport system auxiliary subunit
MRPVAAVLAALAAAFLAGCSGAPQDLEPETRQHLNAHPEIAEKNAHVGRLIWVPPAAPRQWPFRAIVVNRSGERLGEVSGWVNVDERDRLVDLSLGKIQWD